MKRGGWLRRTPRRNKYGAIRTTIGGIVFDSKLESQHYQELMLQEKAGEISGLEIQKEFVISVNDCQICIYIADFFYKDEKMERWVVSDSKGVVTDVFRLKFKLMKAIFPAYIYEIRKKHKVIRK